MRPIFRSLRWLPISALCLAACVTAGDKPTVLRTGMAAEIRGQFDKAIDTYTATLANPGLSDQDRALFLNRRAHAYISKGEFDKAIADTDAVIRLRPDWEVGYNTRALAYGRSHQYELAIADLDISLQLRASPGVYHSRGVTYFYNGQFDEALADLDQALRMEPRYAEAYLSRGSLYLKRGDYQHALSDFNQSIGLQPDNAEAYNGRGRVFSYMGQLENASREYSTALIFQPRVAAIYSNRGQVLAVLGKYEAAAADLAQAIALAPSGQDVIWLHLFRYEAKQDDSSELSRNAAMMTQDPWSQAIASVYLGQMPLDQLHKMAEQANGDVYNSLMCLVQFHTGYVHLLHGDAAAAKPAFREAGKICPATSTEQRLAANELKAIR